MAKTKTGSKRSESKKKPTAGRRKTSPAKEPAEASDELELLLPYEGELMRASNKRHKETIIFVHHFGGSKKSVLRHAKLVNELGFDAVRFDLMFNAVNPSERLPITGDLNFGFRHVWAEQIESILNAIPGKKILFTFSMPSNSALQALAHRHAEDVTAWICDGGPFLQLPRCVWNLFNHMYEIKNPIKLSAYTGFSLLFYGPGLPAEVPALMASLPTRFPILSIRGGKDPLVQEAAIDEVLMQGNDLDVETLALRNGHHVDGIKVAHEEYAERVSGFLKRVTRSFGESRKPAPNYDTKDNKGKL